ncbi:DUF5686 and carboxypeptidase-like regulatory domain-containing protein [Mucilaginibacter paludis]|uniref:Carboxypeptidase-like regulatory domain-containing protein n=1 Tax=Mucilaginibacter paludis DSM 18603 TaxID=714943 RepID=H1Y1B5_9SPHI|nr:DUF5686 and carboxypeptidase-like regulatory domain-containing protein [Mucilaginibacter paludis]EHQ30249.1 hypothetical protein Mucpa_6192 [Mucilaginibacter paludis DSM 18603]
MKYILSAFLVFFSILVQGQTTIIRGVVTDAKTNQTLPYVSVAFTGSSVGTSTDISGKYTLRTNKPFAEIKITFLGYKTVLRTIKPGEEQVINIRLEPEGKTLNEVTVNSAKRQRYRNKDNPAVELIRKVIEHKDRNRIQSYDYAEYQQYEKLQFSFSNLSSTIGEKKIFRSYKFLFDNRDSTLVPGKSLLPVYLDEKLTQNYYRKNPESKKAVVLGAKKVNFGGFIDDDGINTYLNRMYSDVDIYSNNIFLMTNQFLSPIADEAPTFYKFFITDTITDDNNNKLIELSFTPRNTTDMLFEGEIYITLDTNYAVQKAKLSINKNINLNWVRDMYVNLSFDKNAQGRYQLVKSDMMADFGITKKGKAGLFGQRTVSYRNYVLNQPRPDSTYNGVSGLVTDEAKERSDQFWVASRGKDTLTKAESKVYKNIDSLQTIPAFKRTMDIASLVLAGYKSFGPFELGPANAFYSFNPVEGFRLRLGGRTTPELSKRYYFETYGAYGFKDQKWKYFLSATYSLNNKTIYKFPQNYIRASVQRDTKIPGAELQFVQEDNFLLSFKRGVNDKYLYNDFYKVDYVREYESHLSYTLGFKSWKQSPAGSLYFNQYVNGQLESIPNITTSELSFGIRYAPHEQLLQGKIYRITIPSKYPILSLNYTQGVKGLFGGQYNYQNLHARIDKRFYLSQLGYTDFVAEGDYAFGRIPFPLLTVHRANQTYAYQLDSYNLMNFLEFVSDHYASVTLDHCFNGFIFNKVPLLKRLKFREFITFKALYGAVRDENNPNLHPSLIQFPVDAQGRPLTYTLNNGPYTEGSIGIGNILKFFRVDLVERFNYLDHQNAPQFGIRTRARLDF